MSKIALEGNASGTGTLTIASQNTNSNYTLTLPNSTGTIVVTGGAQTIEFAAGTAAAPSITFTGDTNTGIFSPAADTIAFAEGGAEAMRIDSSGNLGLGVTPSTYSSGKAIEIGAVGNGYYTFSAGNSFLTLGGYYNSGWKYSATSQAASQIEFQDNLLIFKRAASGTAGNTLSWSESMRIDSSGNVGIGTSSPNISGGASGSTALTISATSSARNGILELKGTRSNDTEVVSYIRTFNNSGATPITDIQSIRGANDTTGTLAFLTSNTERARITSGGALYVANTDGALGSVGTKIVQNGLVSTTRNADPVFQVNRLTNDGTLVEFYQDSTLEGTISVSGTTVSYNGGNLSRYAQLTVPKDETNLLKGTVMSNLDEMNVYVAPTTYWTEEDELPEGVSVGDVKVETHTVENEQLNKVKVSDVEGDVNVAGVFVNWSYDEAHQVDEINMAMTGDMIIRIAQGVVVQKGDLLMSAGDGTAKPQGDDIVRSKTVAKVTSNHVTCTYADGSYCVPCVLMAC